MYKHLFVPVDGSELSYRAMDGSIDLARQLGARITGFVAEPDLDITEVSTRPATFADRVQAHEVKNEKHAKALLAQFEERAKAAGIGFEGRYLSTGAVDDAIAQEAESAGCDMIVMVTHGRGALGEFIFGSHTKRTISRSKLPVLVLH